MTTPTTPLADLFAPPTRRRPTRKVLAAVGAVVVVVGGFAVHAAAGPSGPSGLRTATVGTSDVDQTLEGVGTVEPVTQAAVAFPVAGTVATVAVAVGDPVAVGQPLATLDPASLQVAIDTQQAAVDQAELVLAKARSGESTGAATTSASTGARGSGAATTIDSAALAGAQQDVIAGQQEVDARLQTAQQALDSADRICAAVGSSTETPPTTDAPTTSTTAIGDDPDDTTTTTSAPDAAVDDSAIAACRTALQGVLDAQQLVSDAQTSLSRAATAYDQLLAQQADQLAASTGQSSGSAGAPSAGTGSAAGASVSSADLIKDQKAVDAAQAQLAVARQALQQATIVSPLAGTVAAVGLAPGDAVTAGSTTATVVVVGEGGLEVTTTVAVDKLPQVRLGQPATVRPDGGRDPLSGKVVAIGVAATSSTGATTYPVTVSLPAGTTGLRNGSVAAVSIVTEQASHALVVPTSAVHTTGTVHTVQVVDGGSTKAVEVKVGAVGDTWTEVTSGVKAGQEVVLADLSEPLPTSATQTATNGRTGTGNVEVRFPGAGFPGRRAVTAGS